MITKKIPKTFFVPINKYQQKCFDIYLLLVENFSQTFFVGGMIRDILSNSPIKDLDIATSATPLQVIRILNKNAIQTNKTNIRFGVIKVLVEGRDLEITSFRKETYTNSRYPKIVFTKSLKEDSKRRDFSINSLYFNAKLNIIIDPQNGLKDLKKRQLRLIGKKELRLKQDPLRIARAFRFLRDYNLHLEKETETALQDFLHHTIRLSRKKILKEINSARLASTKKFLKKILLST